MRKQYPYLEDAYYENAIIATKKRNFLSKLNDLVIQKQYVRITLLNWEEEPLKEISGQITSGSITKDGSSAMRTTGNMTATFSAGDYDVESAQMDFALNKKIYIEIGLRNDTDEYPEYPILWFPQGVFFIGSFSITSTTGGVNISLSLKDKMAGLNGDVGGKFSSTTILDTVDDIDDEGNYSSQKVLLYDLIMELVNHFGGEPLNNIVIEDVDLQIKRIMKWNGDTPLYIWETTGIDDSETSGSGSGTEIMDGTTTAKSFTVTTDQPQEGTAYYRAYDVGADVGYILDDFYYTSDLTAAPGDSVVTILDKIKSYLGNYEYFYDIYGIFHFREIKNYLNTTQTKTLLKDMSKHDYLVETTTSKSSFSFSDNSNLVSITCTPQYDSIKNDFVIQGKRQSTSEATYPVMYHLAIDNKPTTGAVSYEGFCLYQNEDEDTVEGAFPTVIKDELPIPGDASRKFLVREDLLHNAGYSRVNTQDKVNHSLDMLREYKQFFDKDTNVVDNEKKIAENTQKKQALSNKAQEILNEVVADIDTYKKMIADDGRRLSTLSNNIQLKQSVTIEKTPETLAEYLFNTKDICSIANTYFYDLWGNAYEATDRMFEPNIGNELNQRWSRLTRQLLYGTTDFANSKMITGDKNSIKFNSSTTGKTPKELFSYKLYYLADSRTSTYEETATFYPESLRKNSSDDSLIQAGPTQKWYTPNVTEFSSTKVNSEWGAIPKPKNAQPENTAGYVVDELTPSSNVLFNWNSNGSIAIATSQKDINVNNCATKPWDEIKGEITSNTSDTKYLAILLNPYYESFPLNIRQKACEKALEYNTRYMKQLMMEEAAKERGGVAWTSCFQNGLIKEVLTLNRDYTIEGKVKAFETSLKQEIKYIKQIKATLKDFFCEEFKEQGGAGYLAKAIEKYQYSAEQAEMIDIINKEGSELAKIRKKLDTILTGGISGSIDDPAIPYVGSNEKGTNNSFIYALLKYNTFYKDEPLFGREISTGSSKRGTKEGESYRYYYGGNVTYIPNSDMSLEYDEYSIEITNSTNSSRASKVSNYDLLYSIFIKWMDDYRQITADGNAVEIVPQTNVEKVFKEYFDSVKTVSSDKLDSTKISIYDNIKSACSTYTSSIESCTETLTTLFDKFVEEKKLSNNQIITTPGAPATLKDEFVDAYVNKVKEIYDSVCALGKNDGTWINIQKTVTSYLQTTNNSSVQMAEAIKGIFATVKTEVSLLDTVTDNTSSYTKITQDEADTEEYGLVQWSDSCYKFIPIVKYYGEGYGYTCKDWRTEIYVRGMMAKDSNYGIDASQYYENLVSKVESKEVDQLSEETKNVVIVAHNDSVNVDFYFEELQAFWPQIYDLVRQEFIGDQESSEYKYSSLTTGNYFLDFIDANSTELSEFSIGNIGRRTDVVSDDSINCLFEPEIPDILYVNTDESSADEREKTLQQCKELGYGYVQIPGNIYYAMYTGGNHNAAFDQIKYELYIHTLYQKTLSITAIPAWFLQPNTRCTIDDKVTNTYGDFNIKSITLTLGAGSTMSVTLSEALERI